MQEQAKITSINIAILVSGNGSNMENLIRSLHNKTLSQVCQENGLRLQNKENSINQFTSFTDITNNLLTINPVIKVCAVISNKADAYALVRAKNLNIPSHVILSHGKSREDFDYELASYLLALKNECGLDCILLAGFMRILGKEFLDKLHSVKILNIHPSFLPMHKGKDGIKDSFYDTTCDFGGVSAHLVNEELDSGMIILQDKVQKINGEDLSSFTQRIHELEYKLYPQAFLKMIMQGIH